MKRFFIFILLISIAAYASVEFQDVIFKKTISVSGSITGKTSLILEDPGAGTNIVTIKAPTLAGSLVFTLPNGDGNSGDFLQTDGSGILSWAAPSGGTANLTPLVKTANYTLSINDDFIICDTSSNSITLTLPTAVGNDGKIYYIKKIAEANDCVIDGATTETIDAELTQILQPLHTSVMIVSDGSNWLIL